MTALRSFCRKLNLQNRILLATAGMLVLWGVCGFVLFRWFVGEILTREAVEPCRGPWWIAGQIEGRRISPGDVEGAEDDVGRKGIGDPTSIGSAWVAMLKGGRAVDEWQVDLSRNALRSQLERMHLIFFGSLGVLVFVSCLFASRFARHVTGPVKRLTKLADEISVGNLEVDIDFGEHVDCWEIKNCRKTSCAAYGNKAVQCWFVDGTPCEGYEPRFPQKLGQCRKCEVYQAHKGDEIVQLADALKHMTYKLRISQRDLRGAYDLQRCLIQNSFEGIIASDMDGVILIFNGVAEKLTGFSEREVVGRKMWRNFFPQEIVKELQRTALATGGPQQRFAPRESLIFHKDGHFSPILIGGVSLTLQEHDVGRVVFCYDIREIKRLRKDLIQSERMAAVGQTVASISHSIKNILDGLRGGVYVFSRGQKSNDQAKRELGWEMIEKNIDIISELVINLLNYSREREIVFQPFDANRLIREVCAVMERRAESRGIRLIPEGDERIKDAVFDSFSMHQCLLNLVSNAMDAVPSDRSGGRVVVKGFRNEEGHLCFQVTDNGLGMSRSIQDKILKGMFSTKGSKGTGLGLLVVQKIVNEHQGKLEIRSEEDKGSVFTVSLPCWNAQKSGSVVPHEEVQRNTLS